MCSELASLNICYIFQDQYPWDIRVDKIVTSLGSHGAMVHLISRNRSGLPENEQINNNLQVHRLAYSPNGSIRSLTNTPAFFSPFWIRKILTVIRQTHCRLVIVRDLPLALAGILAGRLMSIPVLFDMAENYPAMLADTWKYRGPHFSDYFIRNPYLLRILERFALPRFDGVMPVSEQSKKRICDLGIAEHKVWIVGNTPRLTASNDISKECFMDHLPTISSLKLLYVGGLEESRGLEVVIDTLPSVRTRIPDVLFVIVGEGKSQKYLMDKADRLGLKENVYFAGWREHKEIPAIISRSDVCIIPHYVTEHIDTTLPNKIFDYMLQKKPVLVTHSKSLCEIVEKWECGLSYEDTNKEQLADRLFHLANCPRVRKKFGEAGYSAVMNEYNWSKDEKVLLETVRMLTGAGFGIKPA